MGWRMTSGLCNDCLEWGRVVHHHHYSLIQDHPYPVARLGQDIWTWTGCSEWPRSPYVPQLVLCTPQGIAVTAFLHWTMKVSPRSLLDQVFTCISRQALTHWGFQTHWLPSHGLAGQSKLLPGCGCCCMQTATWSHMWELGARQWPKMDEPPQGCDMSLCQRCYPILTPQTPLLQSTQVSNSIQWYGFYRKGHTIHFECNQLHS